MLLSNILGIVPIHRGIPFSTKQSPPQEPFGAGDTLQCRVSRSLSGHLTVDYRKNGTELGKAFDVQAPPVGKLG